MNKRTYITFTLFILAVLCFSFSSDRTIDITKRWKAKACPVHHVKLSKTEVECVVGGWAGNQPTDSRDFSDPPYDKGKFPNAKYDFYESGGCVQMYDKAIILYCKKCELNKNKSEAN